MKHNYYIDPGIEHYSCMVDPFALAGCFEEAMDLMEEMPFQAERLRISLSTRSQKDPHSFLLRTSFKSITSCDFYSF